MLLQLRVPELKYIVGDAELTDVSGRIDEWMAYKLGLESVSPGESVLKSIEGHFGHTPLPALFNNAAFMTDRVFDVWQRKNQLVDALNEQLSGWRFAVFAALYRNQTEPVLKPVLEVLESIGVSQIGWSPSNKHQRSFLLEHLSMLLSTALQRTLAEEALQDLPRLNAAFVEQQEQKRGKIVERLCASELLAARQRFARWQSIELINRRFADAQLPDAMLCFLARHWMPALAQVCARFDSELLAAYRRHQDQIYAVFCKQGQWAFKYGDNLIDVLSGALDALNPVEAPPPELWQSIEQDIISLLQGQALELYPFTPTVFVDAECTHFVEAYQAKQACQVGQWYWLAEGGEGRRARLELVDVASQQMLFADALGVKLKVLSIAEFDDCVEQGRLKLLQQGASLEQVFESSVAGLYKISDAQSKARIRAAEKAKLEAERLLEEQRRAQQDAQARADEIARKTRELQDKRAEKQRLEQVQAVTGALAAFTVGGWIGIRIDEQVQRYKLAVKIAASGKYIFVDKLGIKRLELNEETLVQRIMEGEITILSAGTEFENSLERVVSRLRIQK